MSNLIEKSTKNLDIPNRKYKIVCDYLSSLAQPADKHTQANAEKISGKDNQLFSNILSGEVSETKSLLNRHSRRRLEKLLKKKRNLVKGSSWTIAIIIDATLHQRSSKHVENAQSFNHGGGWVMGHQWTNIGIFVNDQFVPLPPIPFYTKEECTKRKIDYSTEPEKIGKYLRNLHLPGIPKEEVVVLMDSGYDCKELQNAILKRGWDFICALKKRRSMSNKPKNWKKVGEFFSDGRRPWKSIRIETYRGKRKRLRKFCYKEQLGLLRGVRQRVKLVHSKRNHDSKCKSFVSSNINVDTKTVLLVYRIRWYIEIFHREIKSYLGFEDAGVRKFDSLHNHIHYVFLTYNILKEEWPQQGIKFSQVMFERNIHIQHEKEYIQIATRINGKETLKNKCLSVIRRLESLNAA